MRFFAVERHEWALRSIRARYHRNGRRRGVLARLLAFLRQL
jgi:hypothetical protein